MPNDAYKFAYRYLQWILNFVKIIIQLQNLYWPIACEDARCDFSFSSLHLFFFGFLLWNGTEQKINKHILQTWHVLTLNVSNFLWWQNMMKLSKTSITKHANFFWLQMPFIRILNLKNPDISPISRWWYSKLLPIRKMFLFLSIIKLLPYIFEGTSRNNSLFFFLGILISKQIAPASLFSFQLKFKTPFLKIITDDSVSFFTEVKCKGNTQITNMEETEKCHRVIRLMWCVHAYLDSILGHTKMKSG